MSDLVETLVALLRSEEKFIEKASGLKLREYQKNVAREICQSVKARDGRSFVVMFPRQSGKNELQAQIETYLMVLFSEIGGEMVKISPTWKPQSLNAMRRLQRILVRNGITKSLWRKEQGYIFRVGSCRIYFLSGNPEANIVGTTASTLLQVDEAQDIGISKFDKDILPMAASTNATRVFWGTAWTSNTLLARELRAARSAELQDGKKRVFVINADVVGAEVPAYKMFVIDQVKKMGRLNPMVRTQYYSEEIDGEGTLFNLERIKRMSGDHKGYSSPAAGKIYALTMDVAGEDEGLKELQELSNPGRDSTALTYLEIDLTRLAEDGLPIYKVVKRQEWIGIKHTTIFEDLKIIINAWRPRFVVVDSTGVGAGLYSFLAASYGERIIGFKFNHSSKSQLAWDWLSVIDSGRWREAQTWSDDSARLSDLFKLQLINCQYEIMPGPNRLIKWSVPDNVREDGELVHDDLIMSAALSAELDKQVWLASGATLIARAADPMEELDHGY